MDLNKKNFFDLIKKFVEKDNCSDVHISGDNFIGLRVSGRMEKQKELDFLSVQDTINIFHFILEDLSEQSKEFVYKELKEKTNAAFSLYIFEHKFRINVSNHNNGYHIVFRYIKAEPYKLESLKFSSLTENSLKMIAEKKSGIFFVVGPTGSGKTTTLSSIIDYINENFDKNIITLENPIEYVYKSKESLVVQKELGRDFISFKEALRSSLREDPDIILVGEIRDTETLELALDAAETGHLVFATLHTSSAILTIQRVLSLSDNAELTRDRLKNCFLGSIAQSLLTVTKKDELNKISYSRLLLWEILITNKSISNNIKEGKEIQIAGQMDNTPNCQTYNKTLLDYYKAGIIDLEFALKNSFDKKSLSVMIENIS